jgi:NAD(P) transhydrogenase subunit beta
MNEVGGLPVLIDAVYLVAAALFIIGLKRLSSPATARSGNQLGALGMLVAVVATLLHWDIVSFMWIVVGIVIGGGAGAVLARTVKMTAMPQMVALLNVFGGGASALIAGDEYLRFAAGATQPTVDVQTTIMLSVIIGAATFSGSLIAFGKLQGLIKRSLRFRGQNFVNLAILAVTTLAAAIIVVQGGAMAGHVTLLFVLALLLGVTMTLPIGGADMPVVISLYNALTGLAVAFEGFVLNNAAMIIAGTVVGSAGTLLTQLMAKAMNRSLANVLFSGFGESAPAVGTAGPAGTLKAIDTADVAVMLGFSEKVIVVPGYGMAVAQAQHKVWELCQALIARGVAVKFAIHPVAGRMPGHMNVLLAEAGVPYDLIYDETEINAEFETADAALVIGANDVVNPVARTDKSSPIYGMPILNADKARNVIVIKRGQGAGFSGIENALFYLDHTRMLYGDGQAKAGELVQAVKTL